MAKETYVTARDRLLRELPQLDSSFYEAVTYSRGNYLKYPYLLLGSKYGYGTQKRITFHAQSVHDETGLSLWIDDFRGMSAVDFDKLVRRHYA